MEELKNRYNALSQPIKLWPGAKIAEYYDNKIKTLEGEPTKNIIESFTKKLVNCEKKQKEADEFVPILLEKRNYVQSIKDHDFYKAGNLSKDFMRTLNGIEKKLNAYEWDGDTLIKGKPFKLEVNAINTEHLKKAWEKILPKPVLMDAEAFNKFMATANKAIEEFRPVFLQKGCGEKLEEWNALGKQTTSEARQFAYLKSCKIKRSLRSHLISQNPRVAKSSKQASRSTSCP